MSAEEQEFNLKYRLTGAAILLAVISLVFLLLLSNDPAGIDSHVPSVQVPAPASDSSSEDEGFVSRIITSAPLTRPAADYADQEGGRQRTSQNDSRQSPTEVDPEKLERKKRRAERRDKRRQAKQAQAEKQNNAQGSDSDKRKLELDPVLESKTRIVRSQPQEVTTLNTVQAPQPETATAGKSTVTKQKKEPMRWVLRVGAFEKSANVERLIRKLNDAGYRTGRTNIQNAQGRSMIRVWVGPYDTAREALRARSGVNKVAGAESFVAKWVK